MKKLKEKFKNNKGITLIALVITIIVLLILAGVSIATLTGDNGILKQAQEAKNKTKIAEVKERAQTDILGIQTENEGKMSKTQFVEILNKYFNDVPTEENLPEDLSKLILKTKEEYGSHDIKISEIWNGQFLKTVEDLKAGEKVYYNTGVETVGDNGIIECVVLYDNKYNKTNGTDYGIQIMSSDIINNIIIGYEDPTATGNSKYEKAKNSYNNLVSTLNSKATEYLNKEYAIDARCIGSDPDSKESESGYFVGEEDWFLKEYTNIFKDKDENYKKDSEQMKKNNLQNINKNYFLASRNVYSDSIITSSGTHAGVAFSIRTISKEGNVFDYYDIVNVYEGKSPIETNVNCGIRPVFTLNPNVKLSEGDGINIPYTLEI